MGNPLVDNLQSPVKIQIQRRLADEQSLENTNHQSNKIGQ
jgi:hypothetical protein